MKTPRPFVPGSKNVSLTFRFFCTHQSPWQKVTCGKSLEDSTADMVQLIIPMQQIHLGIVNNGKGLIIGLREHLNDSGQGVTMLLGIVLRNK